MALFRDRAVENARRASEVRKVARMGRNERVAAGRSIPNAPAPYTCGAGGCSVSPTGFCQSTVRGGVCPCRDC